MRRAVAAALLLLAAACGTAEPAATVGPSEGRSLLPPSSSPGSPEPSPSDGAGGGATAGGADTGTNPAPAPAQGAGAPAAPTKAPTPKPTKKPTEPAIAGEVLAGGEPVTDAQVTISGDGYHHNTTTSSQGRFRSATPPGTYTVAASSPSVGGCGPRTVTVKPNEASHVTITCDP